MRRALGLVALVALVAGLGFVLHQRFVRPPSGGPAPTAADIEELTRERTRVQDDLRVALEQNDVLDFAHAPAGNVLVGVPTRLAEDLVGQMVSGLFSEVRLELGSLRAHHEGDVKTRLLFTQTIGHYALDVDVKEVLATLKPTAPDLTFGGNAIALRLPVTVASGRGTGTVRFRWRGQGLAGAVCGDVDVVQDVSSGVRPAAYTVEGDFLLAADADTVSATPRFRDLRLHVVLQPTDATWKALAAAVEDVKDDKNGVCRAAIRRLDVAALVKKAIARGFTVKVPARLIRPVSLPASVEGSIDVQGRTVSLGARPLGLAVTPVMLWYGVDVSVPTP